MRLGPGSPRVAALRTASDLIVSPRDDLALSQFDRRDRVVISDVPVWVASAEDIIVSKLLWAKRGDGSERQLRDVAGVAAVQGPALDRAYVDSWTKRLGVDDLWKRVLDAVPPE